MTTLASFLLSVLASIAAFFSLVLFVEILAAVVLPRSRYRGKSLRPKLAVIVPAHNESVGIVPTLADITAQLNADDRLVVVADNCTDDTAVAAKSAGATVIERNEPHRRGKGFAMDFAIRHLEGDPPEVAVFIDADCRLASGTIDELSRASFASGRPVQARYLCVAPVNAALNFQVAEFAMRIKNWARPLGLGNMGMPCQLTGTGMAMPWHLIKAAPLASSEIVEDLKLGLDLAGLGKPPLFCDTAIVTSEFPSTEKGAEVQRLRWESGHLHVIGKNLLRRLMDAVSTFNPGMFAMVIDAGVPPLVLLGVMTVALLAITALAALLGVSATAFVICLVGSALYGAALALAWLNYGRDVLPPSAFTHVASYLCAGVRRHLRIFGGEKTEWTRTDRDK